MLRILLLSFAILAGQAAQSLASELSVTIAGASPTKGQILLSVFDNPRSWMKRPTATVIARVRPDGTALAIVDLHTGTHAIALIHDVNGNGKMDRSAFGTPKEAFGFSNGAQARFGPPAFGKAAFDVPEDGAQLAISLDRFSR